MAAGGCIGSTACLWTAITPPAGNRFVSAWLTAAPLDVKTDFVNAACWQRQQRLCPACHRRAPACCLLALRMHPAAACSGCLCCQLQQALEPAPVTAQPPRSLGHGRAHAPGAARAALGLALQADHHSPIRLHPAQLGDRLPAAPGCTFCNIGRLQHGWAWRAPMNASAPHLASSCSHASGAGGTSCMLPARRPSSKARPGNRCQRTSSLRTSSLRTSSLHAHPSSPARQYGIHRLGHAHVHAPAVARQHLHQRAEGRLALPLGARLLAAGGRAMEWQACRAGMSRVGRPDKVGGMGAENG